MELPASAPRAPFLERSRAARELLGRALDALELIGGAGEIRPLLDALGKRLGREETLLELSGEAAEAACALLGAPLLPPVIGAGVLVRLRAAPALDYRARFADGRSEAIAPDESEQRLAQVSEAERALAHETETARAITERMQEAARQAVQARAELVKAEEALAALSTVTEVIPPPAPASEPAPVEVPRPRRRFWLWAALAWIFAPLARLFGRRRAIAPAASSGVPALAPAPAPPAPISEREQALTFAERRVVAGEAAAGATEHVRARLEAELDESKQKMAAHAALRERRLEELEEYRVLRRERAIARVQELASLPTASPLDLEVGAPGLPEGVVLLAAAALTPAERAASDGSLHAGERATADELLREIDRLRRARAPSIARNAAAALCSCRNQIVDLERQAQRAHRERVGELQGCRIVAPEAVCEKQKSEAQRPVARHAEQIVQEAAARLERLLDEARASWEERIQACAGVEQLRTEVAAIENGAAHRLSIVCDELREAMTIQAVRLVLELSRPLRQELLLKRLEVARGRSAKAEESFEDIRVVLPASLEDTFKALRAPGLGELGPSTRGIFDPLFRTLAREKREHLARLGARLDEVGQTTARELYAAAVYLSPLLLTRFARLVDELLAAHERWIEARIADEQQGYDELRARQSPSLALLTSLEEEEAALARLLETAAEG